MTMLLWIAAGALAGFCLKEGGKLYTVFTGSADRLLTACTLVLIFCMGCSLGADQTLGSSLAQAGWQSLVLCLFALAGTALVTFLALKLLPASVFSFSAVPEANPSQIQTENKGSFMVLYLLAALVSGFVFGKIPATAALAQMLADRSEWVLYVLLVLVGISIGLNRSLFQEIRTLGWSMLIVPACSAAGSLLGAFLCALLFHLDLSGSMAAASGLGWYSLEGILLNRYLGVHWGSIGFLTNLMREIFTYLLIPAFGQRMPAQTGIAFAGATSTDTSLPVILKVYGQQAAVLSIANGMICSAFVPVFTSLFV